MTKVVPQLAYGGAPKKGQIFIEEVRFKEMYIYTRFCFLQFLCRVRYSEKISAVSFVDAQVDLLGVMYFWS